jgi:hypothetical protein
MSDYGRDLPEIRPPKAGEFLYAQEFSAVPTKTRPKLGHNKGIEHAHYI